MKFFLDTRQKRSFSPAEWLDVQSFAVSGKLIAAVLRQKRTVMQAGCEAGQAREPTSEPTRDNSTKSRPVPGREQASAGGGSDR